MRETICYEEHQERYCDRTRFNRELATGETYIAPSEPPVHNKHGVCLCEVFKDLLRHGLHSVSASSILLMVLRGGELFSQLSENRRFTEERAKFYCAQIALALGYLHKARIIYRDMKPENILINSDGYIVLADFGLAKLWENAEEEPNSFCGTPAYLCKGFAQVNNYGISSGDDRGHRT